VPRGQSEAASALGLRKGQTMRLVLVPQAVRTMLPAIIAQCVVALKDTALGFIIAYPELLRTGQLIYNGFFNIIPTAIVVAAIYVAMNLLLSRLAILAERRQSRVRPVVTLDPAGVPAGTV
jgi:glutamate transport system permease protein